MPVNEHIEVRIGVWFARWVGWVVRWPKLTTLAMLALAGVSLCGAINHLGIVGDTEALFSEELPFKKAERRYYDAFPTLYENIFVVVDAPTPEGAAQATKSLAAKLNAHREDIIRAYVPGGGDFFEEHAFLYLETANQPMHVGAVMIYDPSTAPDGFVRFKDILNHIESRLDVVDLFRHWRQLCIQAARLHSRPLDHSRRLGSKQLIT